MQHRTRGFSLIELMMVLGVMSILMGILIPSVGVVREQAQRMATGQKMRQIGLAVAAYQQTTGRSLVARDLGEWVGKLAGETGVAQGRIFLFEEDPLFAASGQEAPPSLVRRSPGGGWETVSGFASLPLGITVASGVDPASPGSTTPVAWTRGLNTSGTWEPHGSDRAGVYGDTGGFIVFLDGHVEFHRNLETGGGQLVSYRDGRATSDIREALGPGVQAYDYKGRVF